MPRNWEAREKKLNKRRHGMRIDGRSIFVIQEASRDRARRAARQVVDQYQGALRDLERDN